MDAVENDRVGQASGIRILLLAGGVGEQVVLQQLQAEAAVGAADDVAVGVDAVDLRLRSDR